MIFTYFNLLYFLIKLSSSQTSFNIFKNKEEAFKKKKKKRLRIISPNIVKHQIAQNLRNLASNYLQLSQTKNKKKTNEISISLHSHSTLIQYFHNIATKHSTMDYLKLLPTTIPWRRTRHEHNTPCQRWKGHPVDDTGQVYILAWKCPRVSVAARVPVYRARGYKACHVPAGVLPPGVRSSGPNQPASPNQLQRAASPTTIEITLSLAASLPRDSRFSFSLKCHALEMGPLDCRPLDLLILPDHRTIRETGRFDDYADCSWWWSIFYSLSYFLSFLLSLSLPLSSFFLPFSAERIDCWPRSRLIGLDAKDRG